MIKICKPLMQSKFKLKIQIKLREFSQCSRHLSPTKHCTIHQLVGAHLGLSQEHNSKLKPHPPSLNKCTQMQIKKVKTIFLLPPLNYLNKKIL